MKKKRFSVEQIVGVLKQAQVGVPVAEVIRKAGISELTHSTSLRAGCSTAGRLGKLCTGGRFGFGSVGLSGWG
jgi:hypothetical protein